MSQLTLGEWENVTFKPPASSMRDQNSHQEDWRCFRGQLPGAQELGLTRRAAGSARTLGGGGGACLIVLSGTQTRSRLAGGP